MAWLRSLGSKYRTLTVAALPTHEHEVEDLITQLELEPKASYRSIGYVYTTRTSYLAAKLTWR
jgi:hypothetical protein